MKTLKTVMYGLMIFIVMLMCSSTLACDHYIEDDSIEINIPMGI